MALYFKTFLLGKDGEEDGRQDALALNSEKLLFAVADGVSNSFHPEFVAQALCELFSSIDPSYFDTWDSFSAEILLPQIHEIWLKQINEHLASISGRILRHEQYNYERWKYGASTFCGIHIDLNKGKVKFVIIGDSTLFISTTDGKILEFNSMTDNISGCGTDLINYTNTTEAVISDGSLVGKWFINEIPIENVSYIALMTDGMAKWYQKHQADNPNSESILWKLQSKEDFNNLAENCRRDGEMDDDLAVIIIKLSSIDKTPNTCDCIINSTKENINIVDNDIIISLDSKSGETMVSPDDNVDNHDIVSSLDIQIESVDSKNIHLKEKKDLSKERLLDSDEIEDHALCVSKVEVNRNISDINETTSSDINETTPSDINETTSSDINETTPSDINETTPSDINETTSSDINESTFENAKEIDSSTSTDIKSGCFISDIIKKIFKK